MINVHPQTQGQRYQSNDLWIYMYNTYISYSESRRGHLESRDFGGKLSFLMAQFLNGHDGLYAYIHGYLFRCFLVISWVLKAC